MIPSLGYVFQETMSLFIDADGELIAAYGSGHEIAAVLLPGFAISW